MLGSKIIAAILGVISGVVVHFISRALGIEFTLPGCVFTTAVVTAGFTYVRWVR